MKEFNFNVRFMGHSTLTVMAENKEEAKEKVKNLLEGLSLKNFEDKETNLEDVSITYSNIQKNIRQVGAKHYETCERG